MSRWICEQVNTHINRESNPQQDRRLSTCSREPCSEQEVRFHDLHAFSLNSLSCFCNKPCGNTQKHFSIHLQLCLDTATFLILEAFLLISLITVEQFLYCHLHHSHCVCNVCRNSSQQHLRKRGIFLFVLHSFHVMCYLLIQKC